MYTGIFSLMGSKIGTKRPDVILRNKNRPKRIMIVHYCITCKDKKISYANFKTGKKRCQSCAIKELFKDPTKHPLWNGGKSRFPNCVVCNKKLSRLDAKVCRKHFYVVMGGKKHPQFGKHRTEEIKEKVRKSVLALGIKGSKHPMFGKIGTHGKGAYYKNIWMRSSYEIAFARFLDANKVKYQYEPRAFNLVNMTYTPDFYLPETDEYIETKGWFRDDAKLKFDLLKIFYPQVKIEILMKKDLQQMEILS